MTDQTKLVFQGFLNLSDDEKSEFIDEVNKYYNSSKPLQENFSRRSSESIHSIVLGPLGSKCPCCGR